MAASVNKAIIIGNLGRDPELRYMQDGSAVASLTIATTDKWKDKATGETKEQTEWHRVSLFGRLAEIAKEYLVKGSSVYIEGSIRTRKYTDKDGIERYTTGIRGDELKMLGSPGGSGGNQGQGNQAQGNQSRGNQQQNGRQNQSQGNQHSRQGNAPQPRRDFSDFDDDIPF